MSRRKNERIALRLSEDERAKAAEIAKLRGCTLSEAVRLCLSGTRIQTVAVVEIVPFQNSNAGG